jgi:type IV secretion system protein TrbL
MTILQANPNINLAEIIIAGIRGFIEWVKKEGFISGLKDGYRTLEEALFGTPTPRTNGHFVFGQPTNAPWTGIHDALVGGEIMLVALTLLVVGVQGRHTLRIFDFGSIYEARKARKSAWTGAILLVAWYWIAVLLLYLIDGITIALLPDFSSFVDLLVNFVGASISNPILGLLVLAVGSFAMWVFEILLKLRNLLLYIYVFAMPIVAAVAFTNIPVLSEIAIRFAKKFVPLAVLPLPVALLFRGFIFLQEEGIIGPSLPADLQLFISAAVPVIALWLTWKTFKYATPLTAKVIGGATAGAVTVGAVATGAYLAGPAVGATAARWGPRAATGHALASRLGDWGPEPVTDAYGQEGIPEYRRSENDPTYR